MFAGDLEGMDREKVEGLMALRLCLASERQPRLLDLQGDIPPLPEPPALPFTLCRAERFALAVSSIRARASAEAPGISTPRKLGS